MVRKGGKSDQKERVARRAASSWAVVEQISPRRLFRSPPVPNSGLGFKDGGGSELLKRSGKRREVRRR